ncbi:MAG: hypothetical protein AB7O04_15595 [Hyphomonadaceae bacterium]
MQFRAVLTAMAGLTALCAGGGLAAAQVPDEAARQLARQLASYEHQFERGGFDRVDGPYSGGLRQGQSRYFNVTLEAGSEYQIIGVCDSSCMDLDMRLYDQNGAPISENLATDNVPIVSSRPRWTGPFRVMVTMYRCEDPRGCYFAFNVYGN